MHIESRIPADEFKSVLNSRFPNEHIVSVLNELEQQYFTEPRHANSKYVYPYWKVCIECNDIYATYTKEQVTRKKSCSKKCSSALLQKKRKPRPINTLKNESLDCPVCGKQFIRNKKHILRVTTSVCSQQCNGVLRAKALVGHEHKGRGNWSDESKQALVTRMSGDTNPSWKGGITYIKKKGNYKHPKYVKCPGKYISMARPDGFVAEHRLVVAMQLNRLLERIEVVHHINGDTRDNRIENLMLFKSNKDHKLYEAGRCITPLWQYELDKRV